MTLSLRDVLICDGGKDADDFAQSPQLLQRRRQADQPVRIAASDRLDLSRRDGRFVRLTHLPEAAEVESKRGFGTAPRLALENDIDQALNARAQHQALKVLNVVIVVPDVALASSVKPGARLPDPPN